MAIHSDVDGTLTGDMLKDGILFEQTPNWLKFACPKTKPKERALKELKGNDKYDYEVPKSDVYFQCTHKLADGSTVMLLRYKSIPQEQREAFHQAATANGLRVAPLSDAKKPNQTKQKITFASLQ